jgi:hypothetical protein
MSVRIIPEPDEAERKAILAALAAEEAERRAGSERPTLLPPTNDDAAP